MFPGFVKRYQSLFSRCMHLWKTTNIWRKFIKEIIDVSEFINVQSRINPLEAHLKNKLVGPSKPNLLKKFMTFYTTNTTMQNMTFCSHLHKK